MTEFVPTGDSAYADAQRAIVFGAELDTMPLSTAVVERLQLVSGNLSEAQAELTEGIRHDNPDQARGDFFVSHLAQQADTIAQYVEQAEEDLTRSPMKAATTSIGYMTGLLQNYAKYAPAIFKGYRPVSDDPSWSSRYADSNVNGFGKRDEQLIVLAQELEAQGQYDCKDFRDLFAAGLRAGRIQQ
jgi:hypothetical protein